MDSFFKGFNLSNILRQLLCGVVFFVPFVLFRWEQVKGLGILDKFSDLWLLFLLIATCIGTLIYHVEKNLLGYSSQVFRVWCKEGCFTKFPPVIALFGMLLSGIALCFYFFTGCNDVSKYMWISPVASIALLILVFFISRCKNSCQTPMILIEITVLFVVACFYIESFCQHLQHNIEYFTAILLFIFVVALPLFLVSTVILSKSEKSDEEENAFNSTVEETRETWEAASVENFYEKRKDAANAPSSELEFLGHLNHYNTIKAIAQRESGWADFIHCAQTSAIAWILGSFISLKLPHAPDVSEGYPDFFIVGILVALWLLFFEFFCEWHKSLHIDYMLEKYRKIKPKFLDTTSDQSSSNKS